jgi:hypothetical protein
MRGLCPLLIRNPVEAGSAFDDGLLGLRPMNLLASLNPGVLLLTIGISDGEIAEEDVEAEQ